MVYKGDPSHPGTCEIVAQAIAAALHETGQPAGVFSMVQANTPAAGVALVQHPAIKAVGFTGSYRCGKALFDLAMARAEPIPFYGELGSLNPVFVLPAALAARGADLGAAWAGSLTLEAGQLCTKPGMVILPENTGAGAFKTAALAALRATAPQQMRDADTARAYGEGVARLGGAGLDRLLGAQHSAARAVAPAVFEVAATDWLARPDLAQEVFGPAGVLIRTATDAERLAVAKALQGQLTATLLMDEADMAAARALLGVLEHKAGRVLANGFPTEVEVADAVVHGGPFPASTSFGAASGGSMAIRRFLRPVCYQNIPEALLPPDLRGRSQAGCAGVGGRRP